MPPKEKKLLRTFLIELLNSGHMKSLRWVNRENGMFEVLWLHANSPGWVEEHGALFKEWAVYKGRHQQKPDGTWPEADYTTWKANFRCAINRSSEIMEVKVEGGSKELKRYQFCPRRGIRDPFPNITGPLENQVPSPEPAIPNMPSSTDTYATISFLTDAERQYIPEVVSSLPVSPSATLLTQPESSNPGPDVLQQVINDGTCAVPLTVSFADLLQFDSDKNVSALMDMASLEATGIDPTSASGVSLPDSLSMLSFLKNPSSIDMCVWLRYRNTIISKTYVRNDRGCRIANIDGDKQPELADQFRGCKLIGTPSPMMKVEKGVEATSDVLQNFGNGLHLFCDADGNIYATRLSGARIFYADPAVQNAGLPGVLPRKQRVKVFDRKTFMEKLDAWERDRTSGERPSVTLLFSIGESWNLSKPINKCHVNVTVVHALSWAQRMNVKEVATARVEEDIDGAADVVNNFVF